MILLARFILKGPFQAALVVASMALLGLLLPPVSWLSSSAITLVTLVNGFRQGILTMLLAFAAAVGFAMLIFVGQQRGVTPFAAVEMVFYFVLLIWLPAWMAAVVLRRSVSLAYTLQMMAMAGIALVAMVYWLFPDMGEVWRGYFDQLLAGFQTEMEPTDYRALQKFEDRLIHMLPGLFVSSVVSGTLLSLLLGRWWQAVFYNPGGFASEFQSLALGRVATVISLLLILLSTWQTSYLLYSATMIVLMFYFLQGTAILHAVFSIRKWHRGWLVLAYVLMMFLPQALVLLLIAGLIDSWIDIRRRVIPPNGEGSA